MIPAYSEEVKITVVESDKNASVEQKLQQLQEQVNRLTEAFDYINRERSRLKAEVESLRSMISRG